MDPKLQSTYDKVMNTPTPIQSGSSVAQPAVQQSPVPDTGNSSAVPNSPVTSPTGPVIPSNMPQEVPQTPAYTQDNLNFQAAIQTPVVGTNGTGATPAPTAIVPPKHHTSPLLKFLYIIGAIVFFAAYTFLWVRIFNLPVPFLN